MHRSLILPPAGTTSPTEDLAAARDAEARGLHAVWIGERFSPTAPARLAALAAAVPRIVLGLGLVPLTARTADHLEETLTTLALLAQGRVALAFALPDRAASGVRPPWVDRLADVAPVVRRAHIPVAVAVPDAASAVHAAPHVDRVILQSPDLATTEAVSTRVRSFADGPEVEVWLDLAAPEDERELRAVVAERLAVPGVAGHSTAARIVTAGFPGVHGAIQAAYARGRLDEAVDAVPRELVLATGLCGAVSTRIDQYAAAGADRLSVRPLGARVADRVSCMTHLAAPDTRTDQL